MVNLLGGIYEGFRKLDCFLLSQAGYLAGAYGNFIGVEDVTDGGVVNALRRLRGCDPALDPTPPSPQFTGGQCQGISYRANYTVVRPGGNNSNFQNPGLLGPVSGFSVISSGGFWRISIQTGAGSTTEILDSTVNAQPSIQGFVLTREDGQPDNCGDGDPVFPPPTNINVDVDVTYNIEEGPDIDVTIPVIFAPFTFDFSGDIKFPFNFDFGGFEYSGNISFDPEFKVEFNPTFNIPRGIDSPVDTLPPQDNPQDVEQAPPGQVVIGVAVQSVIVGEQQLTTIATQGMPSILAPRAGSIKFAYSLGVSTFWSDDIDVKTPNSFIPCPFSQGADAVVVSPGPGISVSWVPIFGDRLATARDVLSPGAPT